MRTALFLLFAVLPGLSLVALVPLLRCIFRADDVLHPDWRREIDALGRAVVNVEQEDAYTVRRTIDNGSAVHVFTVPTEPLVPPQINALGRAVKGER